MLGVLLDSNQTVLSLELRAHGSSQMDLLGPLSRGEFCISAAGRIVQIRLVRTNQSLPTFPRRVPMGWSLIPE